MAGVQPVSVHLREILKLALPVMGSNLGHVLMGVCDSVMVGHIDAVSLAAAGLATVAFNVLLLFGIGVSYAITPLVAEASGKNDKDRIVDTLRHGLAVNFINACFLVTVVLLGKDLLYHINQPPEVVTKAIPYLNILMFSLIPVLIYQSFRQFAEGMSNTRIAFVIVLGCNVINIGLNWVLIYGHLGFPAYGLNGAGWATLISRVIMAAGIGFYLYHHPHFRHYRKAYLPGLYSRRMLRKLLNLGIPSGFQFIFEVAAFDFSLVMMGWLGTTELAAHQIVINLATLSYMTTSGLAASATIRVAYYSGRADPQNLNRAVFTTLSMGLVLMLLFATVFIAGREILPTLYVHDMAVTALAMDLLLIAGLFQLSDGAQVICIAALRGLQDVRVPSILIFIAYWVIALPMGYWLTFEMDWGAQGIWVGLLIGLTLTAFAMYYRLRNRIARYSKEAARTKIDYFSTPNP